MSRVIAFDIAVVAQKVKVVNEDRCDLFGGGPLVRNRKGSQSNRKDADFQRNQVTLCQIALLGCHWSDLLSICSASLLDLFDCLQRACLLLELFTAIGILQY